MHDPPRALPVASERRASSPGSRGSAFPPHTVRRVPPFVRACVIGVLFIPAGALGARGELIPTPKFSDHAIPTSTVPDVGSEVPMVLDVAILLGALGLASYFTLVIRSRKHLLALTVASLVWFGFYREGCVCPIGATQNVALGIFDSTYVVPIATIAFFLPPLVFTLFFGRTFCAAVCPLGAVQELVAIRTATVPRWLDHSLGLIAYVYLGASVIFAATGTAFVICRFDPFIAFFRRAGNTNMLIYSASVLLIAFVIGRPYCRYLCPYGAILRVLSTFSRWRLSIPPGACVNCRLCENVCPYGAIHPPTVTPSAQSRARGRQQLAVSVVAAPLVIVGFTWMATVLAAPLSQWHPEVRLAEQVRIEESGLAEKSTDASDAFRNSGRSKEDLYASGIAWREKYRTLGGWLGAWTGFVIAVKLVHLSIRRKRDDYQAERSGCVSCGRCYWYCPVEKVRLGLIQDVSEAIDGAKPGASSAVARAPEDAAV
ncbi:MAG: 4Fe-4S binding protein [Planctomycetes bacterium]|nr:4Fe-4S binding protein [Planctomycetota bacterium]